jgi:hypothetical protein
MQWFNQGLEVHIKFWMNKKSILLIWSHTQFKPCEKNKEYENKLKFSINTIRSNGLFTRKKDKGIKTS